MLLSRSDEPDDFGLLTDALLPTLLFCMLGALVWFLLDVVASRFEAPLKLLRMIVFFFLIAVVGIARIRTRGSELSAGTYGLALMAVMGLAVYFFSFGGGAFGGGYGGEHPLALMLLLDGLVVAIWFGAHYLVEQTAIDPDDEALQTAGILSSDEWSTHGRGASALRRRASPGRGVMVLSLVALGIFGFGHRLLQGHDTQGHGFWCMVVFLGSALLVLALAALTGLELYVRGRGARLPWSVTALWLILAVPLAAAFLGLAHVAPKLEPRDDSYRPKLPAWMARFMPPDRDAAFEAPWLGDSPPAESPDAYASGGPDEQGEAGDEPGDQSGDSPADQARSAGEDGETGDQSGEGDGGEGEAQGEGGQEGPGGEGEHGHSEGSGDGMSQDSDTPQDELERDRREPDGQEQQGADATEQGDTPEQPQPTKPPFDVGQFARIFGILIVASLAMAFLLKAGQALRGRFGPWLDKRREAARSRPVVTRDPFVDPFGPRSPFKDRPPAETVVHVYRAFLAYCELLGKPRRSSLTAHEFLFELPASVESWRPLIVELTELYEAVEYTPELVGDEARDELRPIWERLMEAVREVRR